MLGDFRRLCMFVENKMMLGGVFGREMGEDEYILFILLLPKNLFKVSLQTLCFYLKVKVVSLRLQYCRLYLTS